MALRTKEHREAVDAYCSQCAWSAAPGTSRQIRKAGNRHAVQAGHMVFIEYETVVRVYGEPRKDNPQ